MVNTHSAIASFICIALVQGPVVAGVAGQGVRIHMIDGRALDALSCRVDAGVAFVKVTEGASLGVPLSRIASIETLEAQQPPPETMIAEPVNATPVIAPPVAAEPAPAGGAAAGTTPTAPGQAPGPAPEQGPVPIDTLIRRAAERHHLEPELLAAVIAAESGYRPDAQSAKGAQGLMQLMPATARELRVKNPFDAAQNIEAGASYLRQLLDQHGDSFVSALAAYNAGMGRVARYKGVPPYRETIRYINRVLKNYASATQAPAGSTSPTK